MTAEKFWSSNSGATKQELLKVMIEFAKLHVTEALKAASEKVNVYDYSDNFDYTHLVDKNSILTAYPLKKIK